MLFGGAARRNVVDLDRAATETFLRRRDQALPANAATGLAGGPLLVRHDGIALGVASHQRDAGLLTSLYPKGWALAADRSAF